MFVYLLVKLGTFITMWEGMPQQLIALETAIQPQRDAILCGSFTVLALSLALPIF